MRNDVTDSLEMLRHSTAHLLAQAVKQLYPTAQVAIGPVIEDGFYYDFGYERSFTPDDLLKIEARMRELAVANMPITVKTYTRKEALKLFEARKEPYKVEIIQSISENEQLTVYQQGDFQDLCRGPHVANTGVLQTFKLMRVAGAYWRGDVNRPMLQRIYGTAWATQVELDDYLYRLQEAEKRDHRKLGAQLDLFHLQEDAPGMVFWHPKGWTLYQTIQQDIRQRSIARGYQEIHTPLLLGRTLWEQSGHWEKFFSDMFITQTENRELAIKPMNCPGHVQVFKHKLHSYRDLPLRFAEFGCCHRNEPSGSLHGLMRVRSFVQDDGHIFCTEEQIQSEVSAFIDAVYEDYARFGFKDIQLKLATRPEKRVGLDSSWDKAEEALQNALKSKGLNWTIAEGEGAFYGPKIEFSLRDSLNRVWQCGTIQVDFSMPERLGAVYINEDNTRCTPVMLHRAITGSLERFIGILIEHYAGKLPLWLAPVQVVVMTITQNQAEYAATVAAQLREKGIRVQTDVRNEKINLKIREQILQKVPYQIILGAREAEMQTISARDMQGHSQQGISLVDFQATLQAAMSEERNSKLTGTH